MTRSHFYSIVFTFRLETDELVTSRCEIDADLRGAKHLSALLENTSRAPKTHDIPNYDHIDQPSTHISKKGCQARIDHIASTALSS